MVNGFYQSDDRICVEYFARTGELYPKVAWLTERKG